MPNIKSAAKRLRQSEKRRLRNRAAISAMKSAIKKVRECIENKDSEHIHQALADASSIVSKNAKKGIIHRNTAARYQARLMESAHRFLNSLPGASPPSKD